MKPEQTLEDSYTVVAPRTGSLAALQVCQQPRLFAENTIQFVSALSTALLRDQRTAAFPEVIAMAYWLRKANVVRMQRDFTQRQHGFPMPRGTVFHIAPSNVDTIFVYSLFLSMFCGNKNIVRLSSSPNEQVDAILAVMNASLDEFSELADSLIIVRYEHSEELSAHFSAMCDVRMIWGGDETIRRIRSIALPPRAKELTFADRFSMALVDASRYLDSDDAERAACAEAFFNDSFWFDQMACSSPRQVCWLGSKPADVRRAQTDFWSALQQHMHEREHRIAPAAVMDKLVAQCSYAIEASQPVSIPPTSDRSISRVTTLESSTRFREIHCGSGLFLETQIATLDELAAFADQRLQTIACYGVEATAIQQFMGSAMPAGIDRFVPFGQALAFSPMWDGYDLLHELCRNVDIAEGLS